MFIVNNKGTRVTSFTSFFVSIVDFEQENICWGAIMTITVVSILTF